MIDYNYYTGIGSRETPEDVLYLMGDISDYLYNKGWILRSGHADGADMAFEEKAYIRSEIYLPWANFNNDRIIVGKKYEMPTPEAGEIAAKYHPNWSRLRFSGKRLHARNAHQILGRNLKTPSKFVICWTKNGSLDGQGKDCGGTGQALRIAKAYGVNVYNLQREDDRTYWEDGIRIGHDFIFAGVE